MQDTQAMAGRMIVECADEIVQDVGACCVVHALADAAGLAFCMTAENATDDTELLEFLNEVARVVQERRKQFVERVNEMSKGETRH